MMESLHAYMKNEYEGGNNRKCDLSSPAVKGEYTEK